MSIIIGYDVTHANIASAPKTGQAAGYCTGSPSVCWTDADKVAHPGWVQIDQSPSNTPLDETADVLDYENGAATLATLVGWAEAALANFKGATRPLQRTPLIYLSEANLTPVANKLTSAGLANGSIGLFIADWNWTQAVGIAQISTAGGPFPIHAVQIKNAGPYDIDVFSAAWLQNVAHKPAPVATATCQGVTLYTVNAELKSRPVTSADGGITWK
jgi:hypothetical protein